MRKTLSTIAIAAAFFCSCDKDAGLSPCQEERGTLTVSLDFEEDPLTRATSYVEAQDYETAVNRVQVLVFDSSGALNSYVDAGKSTGSISISTTTGSKTVWAVVNGPDLSAAKTITNVQNKAIDMNDNGTTTTKGFVMSGYASCTVSSSTSTVSIPVKRHLARVALQKVTNSLPASYGSITIDNVMLTNVVGDQNFAGTAAVRNWLNKMGRKSGATVSSMIIDGNSHYATNPELTFDKIGAELANGASHSPSTPYLLYGYPNSTSTDATGWAINFTARKTRLVVTATINGTKYYYPITIDSPARNTAYTVELTITGIGSNDPDKPVEKGALSASISVEGWQTGTVYDETI